MFCHFFIIISIRISRLYRFTYSEFSKLTKFKILISSLFDVQMWRLIAETITSAHQHHWRPPFLKFGTRSTLREPRWEAPEGCFWYQILSFGVVSAKAGGGGGRLVHPQTLHLVLLLFLMTFLLLPFLLFLLLVLLLFCKILSLLLDLYHSHCTNMMNVYMWSGLHRNILQRQYFFIPMHTMFYIYQLVCHMRQFSVLVPL